MTDAIADSLLINTKQHRRFAEFLDTCREARYIGLCYGPPGVGKTYSARHYSRWHLIEQYYNSLFSRKPPRSEVRECRSIFYTASVNGTARMVERSLEHCSRQLCLTVRDALPKRQCKFVAGDNIAELLIVDEADRLKLDALEQVRDFHDRFGVGLVLIGMPGLEKRLARYAQLYSRVGFVHEFDNLSIDEVKFILERKWTELGLPFDSEDFTDQEALASIVRITNGNFRLIQRLLSQAHRIMKINDLKLITKEVVETARDKLVIGIT